MQPNCPKCWKNNNTTSCFASKPVLDVLLQVENSVSKMNKILNLPTEICCKILGYLSIYDKVRVKLVCRYWKVILDGNKKLWSRLDSGSCVEETKRGFLTDTVFFHFITNLDTTGKGIVQAAQESGKLATLTSLNLSLQTGAME